MSRIPNLTLVTPSKWLAGLVNRSFLAQYPVKIIYNGIDISVFHITTSKIRERLGITNEKIVLGVAALWDKRKGLDDFIQLSRLLDKEYIIVLVGLSDDQIKHLPNNIIGIRRTNSTHELAELYTEATVFVNPTYEDNYPTTNIEAIACGTPVITYNTGGSPESAIMFGTIVEKGNVMELAKSISTNFEKRVKSIDIRETINEYMDLVN